MPATCAGHERIAGIQKSAKPQTHEPMDDELFDILMDLVLEGLFVFLDALISGRKEEPDPQAMLKN